MADLEHYVQTVLNAETGKDTRWWLSDEPHATIYHTVKELMESDTRAMEYQLYRDLYADEEEFDEYSKYGLSVQRARRDNVIANGVDTVHAKLTQSIPRPYFITSGGDWEAMEKAELLTRFMEGEFDRLGFDRIASDVCKESATVGHGAVLVYEDPISHRPAVEQVYCEDMFVDPREAWFRSVRTKYGVIAVAREVLCERYPDHEEMLATVPPWQDEREGAPTMTLVSSDQVLVVEAWRLPVKQFDEPWEAGMSRYGRGRRVVCCADATLEDDEYTEPNFPLTEMPFQTVGRRYWGIGIAKRMLGSQVSVDILNEIIEESAKNSVPYWAIPRGAGFNAQQLENVPHKGYEYDGPVAPQIVAPPAYSQDMFALLQSRIGSAYSGNGISELEAKSEVPAQFESGAAITKYNDTKTLRFADTVKRLEEFVIETTKRVVAILERVAEDGDADVKQEVLGGDRKTAETICFEDCRLGDAPYTIKIFPTNKLSAQPSAKLEEVNLLMQAGLIGEDDARELLDFPDLDRFNDLASSKRDDVRDAIAACKRKGPQPTAHSFMDYDFAITLGEVMYSLWRRKGAPDRVLERLQNFIAHAKSLKDLAMPPPMPGAPGPMPVDPTAPPMDPAMAAAPPPTPMPAPPV